MMNFMQSLVYLRLRNKNSKIPGFHGSSPQQYLGVCAHKKKPGIFSPGFAGCIRWYYFVFFITRVKLPCPSIDLTTMV